MTYVMLRTVTIQCNVVMLHHNNDLTTATEQNTAKVTVHSSTAVHVLCQVMQ